MGLEPTTFCMAIVWAIRINAWFCGFRVNPITGDYRGFGVVWSPNGPPRVVAPAVMLAARRFCSLASDYGVNMNCASWRVPSLSRTISFRHEPAQERSVCQLYA
jgi:hypothetical protein